jgi:hypothetical protein
MKKGGCNASPIQQAKLLVAISNGEIQAQFIASQ